MDDEMSGPNASPTGIAECLRMLAEEAASLRLVRTLMALLETLEICRIEATAITPGVPPSEAMEQRALVVH
jgi:hypothetical protein